MTDAAVMTIRGLDAEIIRKPIKNLHVGLYPPDGRLRVAAPLQLEDSAVRAAIIRRLPWIRRHRKAFQEQARESKPEFVSGETHWFGGRRYRLQVVAAQGRSGVTIVHGRRLELRCPPGSDAAKRAAILDRWYRRTLRARIPGLVENWARTLGVEVPDVRIRRMKTMWGSASQRTNRIWINLEMAKKPERALDYVVLHELTHLVERHHGERFQSLMDRHLPKWRFIESELGALPLAHDTWAA